jgi:hypothetical protein
VVVAFRVRAIALLALLLALLPQPALARGGYPTCYDINAQKTFIAFFSGNGTIENCRLYRDTFNSLTGVRSWQMHDTTRTQFGWLDADIWSPASSFPRCELNNHRGGTVDLFMTNDWDPGNWCSDGLGEYSL